jgi:hypothetical protein
MIQDIIKTLIEDPTYYEKRDFYWSEDGTPHKVHIDLLRRILPVFPEIAHYTSVQKVLTLDLCHKLNYLQPGLTVEHVRGFLLSNKPKAILLNVACHGDLLDFITPPIEILRYSSVPNGVCELSDEWTIVRSHDLTSFKSETEFLRSEKYYMKEQWRKPLNRTNMPAELIPYANERDQASIKQKGLLNRKHYKPNGKDEIVDKVFGYLEPPDTAGTPPAKIDYPSNFLDIGCNGVKFNLFSIKPFWKLNEIIQTFCYEGSKLVILDHSCSGETITLDNEKDKARLQKAGSK